MEVATVRSISNFEKLLYVSIPWIDRLAVSEDALLGMLVTRPGKRHEHAYEAAVDSWTKRIGLMDPYREHERVVRDSLEDLVSERFVLIDPLAYEDRPLGIEPHSPRNEIMTRIREGIGRGRVVSVGPLTVPIDIDGGLSHPLQDVLDEGFASTDPWSGYYRFNPRIFDEPSDPFDRDATLDARARSMLARGLLALRASAIADACGTRDEIRVFGFSSGVLARALASSPLIDRARFKQIGGRTSKGRRSDEQGLANPSSLATLAAYYGSKGSQAPVVARTRLSATTHPWLLEPYPGRFEIIVDSLERSYGDQVDRFALMMRDRGWSATHALVRLAGLDRVRVSDAKRRSYALDDLVTDVGPSSLEPLDRDPDALLIRPSDALTAPFDCALAHRIASFPSKEKRRLMRSRLDSLGDAREAFMEYRDDDLRSLWPLFGRIAHDVYTYPWVVFESDFGRYGRIDELVERPLEAHFETERGAVDIVSRADVLLEGHSSDGRVPIIIDRKLSGYTESMRHSHRVQLALMFAAYRERILEDGDLMPYGIGIVDASAPHHPYPSGHRPQRFTARLFTNGEVDEAFERALAVSRQRDGIRTSADVLDAKRMSESYLGLCGSCGVYRNGVVKGSLAMRLACDALVAERS